AWEASVNCTPRRQGRRVAPASAEDSWELRSMERRAGRMARRARQLGSLHQRFVKWRVAQLHLARRVYS
ncbi:hypothetical protein A2U01_0106805, partial [Trifolium medium]|nr:hypothetical protein [Trifolium medium]